MISHSNFYNYDRIHSYNCMWMVIAGGRGIGKTYGIQIAAIRDFIRKGDQFVLLRRYKDELAVATGTFFAEVSQEFPDHDFRIGTIDKLSVGQIAPKLQEGEDEKNRPWETMCYFIALSTAQRYKSSAFPRVKKIIFDEFIIEKSNTHYIPNEANLFMNLYSTIDRWKDKTRVYMLANAVEITNPYFLAWGIRAQNEWETVKDVEGKPFVVVHFPDSKDFKREAYKTRFGRFIQGTEFAEFAAENKFSDNHEELLSPKTPNADYLYTLETKQGTFSVWYDSKLNRYFIEEKRPKAETIFTLVPNRMSDSKTFAQPNDRFIGSLRTGWRHGRVYFRSAKSRNAFIEVFKK